MVQFGIDCAEQYKSYFAGRAALLTGPSGRTSDNRSTIQVLKDCCQLELLLAPEHGVRGDKPAGALFSNETDLLSGLPVRSLYTPKSKRLSQETLDLFDTLVYDLADVGCRYYTFLSTLRYCIEDCAAAGKRLVVLDRPNPLDLFDTLVYDLADVGCRYYTFLSTLRYCIEDCAAAGKRLVVLDRPNPLGDRVEGGLLQESCTSFVGSYPLPVCYGLTCGELAGMMNRELGAGCDLKIVPCTGLTRDMTFRDWGHYWVMPSLGIPRYETALLYPGTCLIEGTCLSEGRGTADPFAILGAPFIEAEALTQAFQALALPGVAAPPVYLTPTPSQHQGTLCGGSHQHITAEQQLRPVELGVRLLALLRQMYPKDFSFLPPVREGGKPFISLLAGHRDFEAPDWDADAILHRYHQESQAFRMRKEAYHLYPKE